MTLSQMCRAPEGKWGRRKTGELGRGFIKWRGGWAGWTGRSGSVSGTAAADEGWLTSHLLDSKSVAAAAVRPKQNHKCTKIHQRQQLCFSLTSERKSGIIRHQNKQKMKSCRYQMLWRHPRFVTHHMHGGGKNVFHAREAVAHFPNANESCEQSGTQILLEGWWCCVENVVWLAERPAQSPSVYHWSTDRGVRVGVSFSQELWGHSRNHRDHKDKGFSSYRHTNRHELKVIFTFALSLESDSDGD